MTYPDLRPFFKHAVWRPMPHSGGVEVGSDFADKADNDPVFGIFKECGFWTRDEVAILFEVAQRIGGDWLDIGGLTGWTAAHLARAGCSVVSVDPMYAVLEFRDRALENLESVGCSENVALWIGTSDEFFEVGGMLDGIVIDGDHASPHPLHDAIHAAERLEEDGVILFHDGNQPGVREGYEHLQNNGWKLEIHSTPHTVVVCTREFA